MLVLAREQAVTVTGRTCYGGVSCVVIKSKHLNNKSGRKKREKEKKLGRVEDDAR